MLGNVLIGNQINSQRFLEPSRRNAPATHTRHGVPENTPKPRNVQQKHNPGTSKWLGMRTK